MKYDNHSSWILAGTYLVFSTCWIIFSDLILENYISGFAQYAHAQTIKGLFFISLSTTIILVTSIHLNRKKNSAEGQMRKAKNAFLSLFKKAPVGYSVIDREGKIHQSNSRFRKTLKIPIGEAENNIRSFFNADDSELIFKWMNTPAAKGQPESQILQRKMKRTGGSEFWAMINISRINQDGQFLISIQDISFEKETLHELYALKSELREIGKEGNIGHWELDAVTGEIILSDEIRLMLNTATRKQTNSKNDFFNLLSEKEANHVRNAMQYSKSNNCLLDVTFEFLSGDFEMRYFRLHGNWKTSAKTHQPVLAGTIRDISIDVKLLQKQRDYARHIETWTGAVSHDLRKPIVSLGGLLNLLEKRSIPDKELEEIIRHMKQSYLEMDIQTRQFGVELVTHKKSMET